MKLYFAYDSARNISAISTIKTEETPNSADFSDALYPEKLEGYYIENGALVFSEELLERKKKDRADAEAIEEAKANIEYLKNAEFLNGLSDEDALLVAPLYPQWAPGLNIKKGRRYIYEGVLYTALKDHPSQESWTPEHATSLFAKVLINPEADPDDIPKWEQPGPNNGYMIGDKVEHNGEIYISKCDANIWEPGVVGTEALWDKFIKEVFETEE